ncbi:15649_t:CDS:1, partial [Racocetra fulgida]
ILGDLSEHSAMTSTYNSVNCNMPCHFCLTPKEEFNNPLIDYKSIILCTPTTMKQIIKQSQTKEYSIYDMENSFW